MFLLGNPHIALIFPVEHIQNMSLRIPVGVFTGRTEKNGLPTRSTYLTLPNNQEWQGEA